MDVTGPMTIPNTGGWQAWTNVTATVTLSAGVQAMRVVFDRAGPTGVVGNLNDVGVDSAAHSSDRRIEVQRVGLGAVL